MTASPRDTSDIAARLLHWFDDHGRHDLPWQHPRTPYRVWLSEIMLQQTQVRVVVPYFERFVAALPDLQALAQAPLDQVLALWSGLGYYARARNMYRAAVLCAQLHDNALPRDLDALMALPGIGRSTAGAILSQAWGDRFPIMDGNVKRVLCRIHGIQGWPGKPQVEKLLWSIAQEQLPDARMADYTQAQMDFGATLCTRHDPACAICPLQQHCIALREGLVPVLPTPKPGKPLPQRHTLVLLLQDARGRVLLQRRPPAGIWAALWSLPEAGDATQAHDWIERHVRSDVSTLQPLAAIEHAFTHFKLQLQPLQLGNVVLRSKVSDTPEMGWFDLGSLADLGIPAPIRRLLETRMQVG